MTLRPRLVAAAYRYGSVAARALPRPVAAALAELGGRVAVAVMAERAFLVGRNLERIAGRPLEPGERQAQLRRVFASYARYWVESFRLPRLGDAEVDEGHDVTGFEHIARAMQAGRGVILVLPHLGGWEWSAFWLARINGLRVTAVVEPLQPPELMDWFVAFRESLGMTIVPLGPTAGQEVLAALRRNEVVCLLADRDIAGGGIEVDFFGERTTLPAGPAMLALRAGVPLCPTAVYFHGRYGHRAVVRPPLDLTRTGALRADVARLTQDVASELEALVRAAPEQWHLMQPNWPSDLDAVAGYRARRDDGRGEPGRRRRSVR